MGALAEQTRRRQVRDRPTPSNFIHD